MRAKSAGELIENLREAADPKGSISTDAQKTNALTACVAYVEAYDRGAFELFEKPDLIAMPSMVYGGICTTRDCRASVRAEDPGYLFNAGKTCYILCPSCGNKILERQGKPPFFNHFNHI